jgi:hypothetical protein
MSTIENDGLPQSEIELNESISEKTVSDDSSAAVTDLRGQSSEGLAEFSQNLDQDSDEVEESNPIDSEVLKADIDRQRNELQTRREEIEKQILEYDDELSQFDKNTEDLIKWSQLNQKSYSWKTLGKLNEQLDSVSATLKRYAQVVDSFEMPEFGVLAKARKKFHAGLNRSYGLIIVIATILWNLQRILEALAQIEFFANLAQFTSFPTKWEIIVYSLIFALLFLIFYLTSYYKTWTAFVRKVTLILWELDLVTRNTAHCRSERARLEGLYPQVKDWLEVLGCSLNQPWHVREDWLSNSSSSISLEHSPFSLRIAQAQEDDPTAAVALRRDAIERHLRRGWRELVFESQVEAIRKLIGLPENRLDVEILDRDITYSPGGPRHLVMQYISDLTALTYVAKSQLVPLMNTVQTESITMARPPVAEMRDNPLEPLLEDDLGLGEENKLPWDKFLSLAIASDNRAKTPLSVLTFSSSGRQTGHADQFQTILYGPERLLAHVFDEETLSQSYTAQSRLPLDIVVRVDITGPIPRNDLLISQESHESIANFNADYESQIEANKDRWRSGT